MTGNGILSGKSVKWVLGSQKCPIGKAAIFGKIYGTEGYTIKTFDYKSDCDTRHDFGYSCSYSELRNNSKLWLMAEVDIINLGIIDSHHVADAAFEEYRALYREHCAKEQSEIEKTE